jgi:hypothetical protein
LSIFIAQLSWLVRRLLLNRARGAYPDRAVASQRSTSASTPSGQIGFDDRQLGFRPITYMLSLLPLLQNVPAGF